MRSRCGWMRSAAAERQPLYHRRSHCVCVVAEIGLSQRSAKEALRNIRMDFRGKKS